jgi:hypothetical protein
MTRRRQWYRRPRTALHEGAGLFLLEDVPGETVGVIAGRFLGWSKDVDLAECLLDRLDDPPADEQLPPGTDVIGGRVDRVPESHLGLIAGRDRGLGAVAGDEDPIADRDAGYHLARIDWAIRFRGSAERPDQPAGELTSDRVPEVETPPLRQRPAPVSREAGVEPGPLVADRGPDRLDVLLEFGEGVRAGLVDRRGERRAGLATGIFVADPDGAAVGLGDRRPSAGESDPAGAVWAEAVVLDGHLEQLVPGESLGGGECVEGLADRAYQCAVPGAVLGIKQFGDGRREAGVGDRGHAVVGQADTVRAGSAGDGREREAAQLGEKLRVTRGRLSGQDSGSTEKGLVAVGAVPAEPPVPVAAAREAGMTVLVVKAVECGVEEGSDRVAWLAQHAEDGGGLRAPLGSGLAGDGVGGEQADQRCLGRVRFGRRGHRLAQCLADHARHGDELVGDPLGAVRGCGEPAQPEGGRRHRDGDPFEVRPQAGPASVIRRLPRRLDLTSEHIDLVGSPRVGGIAQAGRR